MITRNLPAGKEQPAHNADKLTAICVPILYVNMAASMSQNPMGLHGLI
jgi:hypothetical protein